MKEMKSSKNTPTIKNSLIAILAMTLLFMGCAKERPEREAQADEENVSKISDFQNKEISLVTLNKLDSTPLLTDAKTVSANISQSAISDEFSLVSYKTDSNLFEDVPLFALPGQKYTLRYEVTNKYLIVNKVAKAELIPFHERTYAKKEGDLLIVPMVGYPVTLLRKDILKNANNERTNSVIYIPVKKLTQATHLRVDNLSRITFEAVKKQNVLPINFFISENKDETKEWFYASTIVGAPPEYANSIGFDVTEDFRSAPVSRIKFIKNKNSIIAVNLNIDSAIDLTDENNFSIAVQIPVEWVDYRRKKEGDNLLLKEETLNNKNIESKAYQERKFIKLDYAKVTTAASGGFNTSFSSDYVLDDIEMTDGYLSFVTHHTTSGIKTRYSFRRAHKPKESQAKRYFKDDRELFGYFQTNKSVIMNHKQIRPEDREKNILINHYMPDTDKDGKRKIIYHFSRRTSEDMKNVGRIAINEWNKTFQEAETGIEIVLDERKTVKLGDIRYNIINVVDNKNGGNLLGYGPTIADSKTGEIISGTSNIYADPFREGLIRDIRNYIRARRGLFEKNYLKTARPPVRSLGTAALDNLLNYIDKVMENRVNYRGILVSKLLDKELPKVKIAHDDFKKEELRLKSLKGKVPTIAEFILEVDSSLKKIERSHHVTAKELAHLNSVGYAHHAAFENTSKDIIEEIESRCKDELDDYISELEREDALSNDRELEVIYACIEKKGSQEKDASIREQISLLESRVLSTLVHEMGHNFSLRHNFLASTDTRHFKNDGNNTFPQSASCMDYNRGNVHELISPGVYDIEAIRFAYGNAVKTESGKVIKNLSKDKPLESQIPMGEQRFALKFCTDHHASGRQIDPLCARHDHGENPLQVVKENIDSVNATRAVHGYRYDLANSRNGAFQGQSIFLRNLMTLKKIYVQWRYHLATFVGEENRYLESYSEEDLTKPETGVFARMAQDKGVHGKNYADYHDAAQLAYEFLKELAFTTAKYCIVSDNAKPERNFEIFDFETLQKRIFKDTKGKLTIQSCEDLKTNDQLVSWIENEVGPSFKYHGSTGEYANDVKESLDPKTQEFLDTNIAGFQSLRIFAFVTLTMRSPDMYHVTNDNFMPNFLDRKKNYHEIENLLLTRAVDGFTPKNSKLGLPGDYQVLKYQREYIMLAEMMSLFGEGLQNPDNTDAGQKRSKELQTIVSNNPNVIPQGYLVTPYASGIMIAASPRSRVAGVLVQKRMELQRAQLMSKEPLLEIPTQDELVKTTSHFIKLIPPYQTIMQPNFTMRQLITIAQQVQAKMKGVLSEKHIGYMRTIFGPYLSLFASMQNIPQQAYDAPAAQFINTQEMVQTFSKNHPELMNMSVEKLKEQASPLSIFSRELSIEVMKATPVEAEKYLNTQKDYIKNRKDRDAQLNMITDMLLRFGGHPGIL